MLPCKALLLGGQTTLRMTTWRLSTWTNETAEHVIMPWSRMGIGNWGKEQKSPSQKSAKGGVA